MIIKELYKDLKLTSLTGYSMIKRDGSETWEEAEALAEHLIEVYVNETLTMQLVCLPQYLTELVLGRLLTENIISCADDVESIYVCEFGTRARVMLKNTERKENPDYVETTPSCCTSNHILNDYFVQQKNVRPVTPIPWKKEWIFNLADAFAAGMPIHQKTYSTHSAFLAMEDKILFACEDIGRHNALDKVIGYALRNNIDLSRCIIYSNGRIPTDMVMKVINAGVPILASKAALTDAAVELARHYQLTLICAARKDCMKQYTGPECDHL